MLQDVMPDPSLLISSLIEHAARRHPKAEIVSRTAEGPIHRTNYGNLCRRSKQVANALLALGVKQGDRIASMAWNGYRHMELHYGAAGMGAVLHTINPHSHPAQIERITNHAADQYLFFDVTFAPLVERLAAKMKTVKAFIAMTDRRNLPTSNIPNLLCYEDQIGLVDSDYEWPVFDERAPASLCYASGSTGDPNGVLYSHRSTVLHAYAACAADGIGISEQESALLVVPMFHVNSWGMPNAGTMSGAKLVMPGPALDGNSVYELMRDERVTLGLGEPAVWRMLFHHVQTVASLEPRSELCLRRVVVGGSAAGRAMVEPFASKFGATVKHAWEMAEKSYLGTACS